MGVGVDQRTGDMMWQKRQRYVVRVGLAAGVREGCNRHTAQVLSFPVPLPALGLSGEGRRPCVVLRILWACRTANSFRR